MKVGSLFSGYGGLDMAVQAITGASLAWVCDVEPASCKILEIHHPNIPNIGDATKVNWDTVEHVDILTAGYPCQPFSTAGNRKGSNDERHLWPYVKTAIGEMGPRLVFLENVAGHLSMGFAAVVGDLAALGYDAKWGIVRASDAGAPHQRKRLFIVAYPTGAEWGGKESEYLGASFGSTTEPRERAGAAANASRERHGSGQGPAGLGRLDREDAGYARQRQRAWQESRTGSAETATDADSASSETWQHTRPHSQQFREQPLGPAAPAANTDGARRIRAAQLQNDGADTRRGWRHDLADVGHSCSPIAWGRYESAIARWEPIIGRPAPAPTIRRRERDRLNPVFVEWMMGLPEGWVTGHDLTTSQCLKLLGNGVVPQQALLAYRTLL